MNHSMKELPKTYDAAKTEDRIYKLWEKSGFFNPDKLPKRHKKPFTIIMPPPNANDPLHIGHAVFVTVQDIMIRFARMKGQKTLWLPGEDHAGFETQVVYEKKLQKQGKSRLEMTREQFYKDVWDYTKKNRKTVKTQLKKLGASCDWSRETFTLDPHIIKIVYATFKDMVDDGLVYRGERLVNYCTHHQTAFSDLEIQHETRKDPLYYIKYGPITLATVRPETKFGDTAIAVHPKDKRYKKYVGKEIEIDTLLGKKTLKVIADNMVDPDFGTGAVKVTPAHDQNDYELWLRHKDEIPGPVQVISQDGRLGEKTGPYKGMKIIEARMLIVKDMEKQGLIEKVDNEYEHSVGLCYKCKNVIEPMLMKQWFLKTKPLAKSAITSVKTGKTKIIPKNYEKTYFHWLNNIRDWNISRQNWWGIAIPAWFCGEEEKTVKKMGFAGDVVPQLFHRKTRTYRLRDHEFRSGDEIAFENSKTKKVFGYGIITDVKKTTVSEIDLKDPKHGVVYQARKELIAAFKQHHPDKTVAKTTPVWIYTYKFKKEAPSQGCGAIIITDGKTPSRCKKCGSKALIQDPDVFDTWFSSAQWPFATLHYPQGKDFTTFYPTSVMETAYDILFFWVARMMMLGLYRTGKVPFETVYLHGLVRDKDRQKMSKSKGNVINPLGVLEQYGTDALRLALIIGNMPGKDVVISEDKIRGYRNFINKLWNISRFVLRETQDFSHGRKPRLHKDDVAILKEFEKIVSKVTNHMESFQFSHAADILYHYTWHTYADNILEKSKSVLKDPKKRAARQYVLLWVLENILKLLHPFTPFVTEELYQKLPLPKKQQTLMIEQWPK